jgi:Polyprenyl synthetase
MRHVGLGGGKRLRPFLVLESAGLFGAPSGAALTTAAAVECVHCYSLVHDDLPAMDNDDLRRGKPTVHKAFDEWTAILAGDALLTVVVCGLAVPRVRAGLLGGAEPGPGPGPDDLVPAPGAEECGQSARARRLKPPARVCGWRRSVRPHSAR